MNPGPYTYALLTIKGDTLGRLMEVADARGISLEAAIEESVNFEYWICVQFIQGRRIFTCDKDGNPIEEVGKKKEERKSDL